MRLRISTEQEAECLIAIIEETFGGKLSGNELIKKSSFKVKIERNNDNCGNLPLCSHALVIENYSQTNELYNELIEFIKNNRENGFIS